MSSLGPHCLYWLDLFAHEGPMAQRQITNHLERFGQSVAVTMEEALHLLVRSGDVLMSQNPIMYYVAPARFIAMDGRPDTYRVLGHPAATSILSFCGELSEPGPDGARYFVTALARGDIETLVRQLGVTVEEALP